MGLHTKTQVYVGVTPIPSFKEFTLHQPLGAHNTFEIVCRLDVLENDVGDLASVTKDFLGELLTIEVGAVGFTGFSELRFKGVVTAVRAVKGYHLQGGDVVVISGKSTSIITDDGSHMASFNNKGLSDIVSKTLQAYDQSKLEVSINPKNKLSLHYCVQHQESSFAYVNRLAKQYGEWFYSNGKTLIFGTPDDGKEISLRYGQDLKQFSFELAPQSSNYNYFTNDYITDKIHTKTTKDISTGVNGYTSFTSQKSKLLYAKETDVYLNSYNDPQSKQRLDTLVALQKKALEQQQVVMEGVSVNPGLVLGALVKIENEKGSYGTFRISEITHTNNEDGKYENTFRAVSADNDAYPLTDISLFPRSETQTAIVKENNDPDGMGRIKVQFPWQKKSGTTTPWIRIVTPHGGGDKGFHFIPELEEEILVGFEGGNAECPYMIGSLYHKSKQPESWKTDANDIKAIRTRSGHTIELNDMDGKEFITITDKNQNLIHIDTANNNMTITAIAKMTLNATNFEMNVSEDAVFNIGKDTKMYTEMNFESSARSYTNTVEDNMKTAVGGELVQNSGNAEIQSQRNMKIACGATATFQGGGNVKISKG